MCFSSIWWRKNGTAWLKSHAHYFCFSSHRVTVRVCAWQRYCAVHSITSRQRRHHLVWPLMRCLGLSHNRWDWWEFAFIVPLFSSLYHKWEPLIGWLHVHAVKHDSPWAVESWQHPSTNGLSNSSYEVWKFEHLSTVVIDEPELVHLGDAGKCL